jgi:hypothetical protein
MSSCRCGCGASLAGMRSDAFYASEACSKRHRRAKTRMAAERAASPDKARTRIHVRVGPYLEFDVPPDWPDRSAKFWRGVEAIATRRRTRPRERR